MTNIISLKAKRTKTDITTNPVTNINITNQPLAQPSGSRVKCRDTTVSSESVEDIMVTPYDEVTDDVVVVHTDEEHTKLVNEVRFLKIIVSMLNDNPLMYSGCLLVDDDKLVELLLLLTQADEVQIDADDIAQGCITGRTYRKVHAIYITKDGETKQLKYDYPELCQELNDLKVMWKYVW